MNVTIDIVLPPVIVAMLMGIIITTNSLIVDSTVENRLTYELQYFANTSANIVQHEMRGLTDVIQASGPHLRYSKFNQDTVHIYQEGRDMKVATEYADGSPNDTTSYPAKLSNLEFTLEPSEIMLQVRVVTESRPNQEVGNNSERYQGMAEKSIYLRNKHMSQL
ncbi:hypothetical protein NC796_15685 [Aliifodinibius sp. S!AR15-10]|uniref:hypothetical protein n=1 Tax=Aliifodinibius sp. S!AR15-10 TaxID=2950437 RepID=UPI00285FEDE0|nr:hypothetical protein [Aliifodinibius sp. S!AR15-10]MDR8392597.1 hypothetical protein [Aliifodinibius sp. S!AR15-10]